MNFSNFKATISTCFQKGQKRELTFGDSIQMWLTGFALGVFCICASELQQSKRFIQISESFTSQLNSCESVNCGENWHLKKELATRVIGSDEYRQLSKKISSANSGQNPKDLGKKDAIEIENGFTELHQYIESQRCQIAEENEISSHNCITIDVEKSIANNKERYSLIYILIYSMMLPIPVMFFALKKIYFRFKY